MGKMRGTIHQAVVWAFHCPYFPGKQVMFSLYPSHKFSTFHHSSEISVLIGIFISQISIQKWREINEIFSWSPSFIRFIRSRFDLQIRSSDSIPDLGASSFSICGSSQHDMTSIQPSIPVRHLLRHQLPSLDLRDPWRRDLGRHLGPEPETRQGHMGTSGWDGSEVMYEYPPKTRFQTKCCDLGRS